MASVEIICNICGAKLRDEYTPGADISDLLKQYGWHYRNGKGFVCDKHKEKKSDEGNIYN